MNIAKKVISTLKEVHSSGVSSIEQVAAELRAEIETNPQMLGIYCYTGTPIPIAYCKGIIDHFYKKD
jgi:hypothetical protein